MIKNIAILVSIALISGCKDAAPAIKSTQDNVLTGVIIREDWSKSLESWNAGGSEYYVLKVEASGQAPGTQTTENRVILRPSDTVPFDYFKNFAGRRVTCRGQYVAGERYVPEKGSVDQIPGPGINPITGEEEYPIVGSGFKVNIIETSEKNE